MLTLGSCPVHRNLTAPQTCFYYTHLSSITVMRWKNMQTVYIPTSYKATVCDFMCYKMLRWALDIKWMWWCLKMLATANIGNYQAIKQHKDIKYANKPSADSRLPVCKLHTVYAQGNYKAPYWPYIFVPILWTVSGLRNISFCIKRILYKTWKILAVYIFLFRFLILVK